MGTQFEEFSSIPSYSLRYANPSPIHPFVRSLTETTSKDASFKVWVKREDQSGPLLCCGNKYRKLEYLIPDILNTAGVTTIVTEGGLQSNHAAQVSVVASKLNLECVLILDEDAGGLATATHKDVFRSTGNFQVYSLLGSKVLFSSGKHDKDSVLAELRAKGKVPYWIPSGSSTHPLGGLGYVGCALEIASQEEKMSLPGTGRYDYIFVTCGSGSTIAGLIAGFRMLDKAAPHQRDQPKRQIIGIMVSPKVKFDETILSIAQQAGKLSGLDPEDDLRLQDVRLDDRFYGPDYGVLDEATQRTIETVARSDGVLLDPVYTGKAAKGMLHWIRSGELEKDCKEKGHEDVNNVNVLFIHTGGQTVFSAYATKSER